LESVHESITYQKEGLELARETNELLKDILTTLKERQ